MSFLGVVSGSNQKRRINQSFDAANQAYDTSNEAAKGYLDQGYQGAKGYIDQGAKSGQAGGKLYQDTLGINGADARTAAQGTYLSDDVLAQTRAAAIKRNAQQSNATGGYALGGDGTNVGSGVGALADSRTMLENYGNWQNRLAGEEARGDQYTLAGANNENAYGQNQANRETSYGSAKAGSEVQRGAALSANDNTGVNNLFKGAGLAVSAFTGVPTNALGGKSSTTPGTSANGGWQTTTTRANPWNPMNWWS